MAQTEKLEHRALGQRRIVGLGDRAGLHVAVRRLRQSADDAASEV